MIWKTGTHQFTATICQRTGKTCPALARAARAIVQAMATAGPATTDAFEVEGSTDLAHCLQGCAARFHAQHDQVRIYCGVDAEIGLDRLDDYAELMFGTALPSLPATMMDNPPCAMLEAVTLAPQQATAADTFATA